MIEEKKCSYTELTADVCSVMIRKSSQRHNAAVAQWIWGKWEALSMSTAGKNFQFQENNSGRIFER